MPVNDRDMQLGNLVQQKVSLNLGGPNCQLIGSILCEGRVCKIDRIGTDQACLVPIRPQALEKVFVCGSKRADDYDQGMAGKHTNGNEIKAAERTGFRFNFGFGQTAHDAAKLCLAVTWKGSEHRHPKHKQANPVSLV